MRTELSQWDRWKQTRSRGRARYIWLYGVCGWGISVGVLTATFLLIDPVSSGHPVPAIALLPLVLGPMGGYFFGLTMWNHIEGKYAAAQMAEQKEREEETKLNALASEVQELRDQLKQLRSPMRENQITILDD